MVAWHYGIWQGEFVFVTLVPLGRLCSSGEADALPSKQFQGQRCTKLRVPGC